VFQKEANESKQLTSKKKIDRRNICPKSALVTCRLFYVQNKTIAVLRGADESQLPRQPLSLGEDGQREFFSRRDPGESSNA
jgi:hypothetical protein